MELDESVAAERGPLEAEQLLALDAALGRLEEVDARQAKVVEMRYFAGMSLSAIAEVLEVSRRTVDRDWLHAKSWLARELSDDGPG